MPTDLPMPMLPGMEDLSPVVPARWKLTAATATSLYDCTPHGIASRCHGKCCYGPGGWPPRPDGACTRLDPATGCTMGASRPVVCHLYPLRLNPNGTLVIHGATRWPSACCKGNRGAEGAPMLVDALRPGLEALVGPDEYARVRAEVVAGRDVWLTPLPGVVTDLEHEREMEMRDEVPPPSRHRWAKANPPPPDRPRMIPGIGMDRGLPPVREAVDLYHRTGSMPLLPWPPVPDELADYLESVYAAGGQPVTLDRTGPADGWPCLWPAIGNHPDLKATPRMWVLFSGGKDSVAAALLARRDGWEPVLYHLAGINRGMGDEPRYAERVAARMGMPLLVDRVGVSGKKSGFMELPTKNQVTALCMLARMMQEVGEPLGGADYTGGWHPRDTQADTVFGYDYTDGTETLAAFHRYLQARVPELDFHLALESSVHAWAVVANAGLLQYIKSCVCPPRYKARVRAANVRKFGWLLAGRCGSCVKCAFEELALQRLGVLPPDEARLRHGRKWLLESPRPAHVIEYGLEEFLVPAGQVTRYGRREPDWPDQPPPPDEWEGTPRLWMP